MIDTVVFDLDGTLLNTITDLKNSINRTLIKYNCHIKTEKEILSYVGNGLLKLAKRSFPEYFGSDLFNDFFNDFKNDYLHNYMNNTSVYPGIIEVLSILKEKKYKLAIVSNKADGIVKELANQYFNDIFDLVLGETESIPKKPAPDVIIYVANALNTSISNILYIGDSEVDIETAINANITCLSATWGFRNKQVLLDAGANITIDNPKDILLYL